LKDEKQGFLLPVIISTEDFEINYVLSQEKKRF